MWGNRTRVVGKDDKASQRCPTRGGQADKISLRGNCHIRNGMAFAVLEMYGTKMAERLLRKSFGFSSCQ